MGRYLDLAAQVVSAPEPQVLDRSAREEPETLQESTLTTKPQETIEVEYQRIYYDWAIADGTYTPQQLRKAKVVVKAWGTEQTYPLTWSPSTPGGAAEAQHLQTPQTTGDW